MTINSRMGRREFLGRTAIGTIAFTPPRTIQGSTAGEYKVALSTWPHRIYKENDGVVEPAKTESFVFNLVVREEHSRAVDPANARLEFYCAAERVHIVEFSQKALAAMRSTSISGDRPDKEEELYDFRHFFSLPVSLGVDRLKYVLTLHPPDISESSTAELDVPLLRYEQKTKLIFPLRGKFIVVFGHDFNELHSTGRSQHFAYDILGTGSQWELATNRGRANQDFSTWGREVLAPADGTVVYARNDVPDNKVPGSADRELYMGLPNPVYAIPGNHVLIDHGNSEYSSLGHMQHGSVRVKTGDRVKQGDVMGLVGSAGSSDMPHLHYQLTSGEDLFLADGLPSSFENIIVDFGGGDPIKIATPKRGLPLEAR